MKFFYFFSLVSSFFIISCSTNSASNNSEVNTQTDWFHPAVSTTWQWQLGGTINETYSVEIYDVDLFNTTQSAIDSLHAVNKKVICYFSAGSYENFRADKDSFNTKDLGNTLDGWANEQWLNIRSNAVLNIMKTRLDLAKQKDCDGVEPDNMDGYQNNSGFVLTAADQLNFNQAIAKAAHERGLSVGLKNDLDQINQLVSYFDFAVNEQCFEYDECDKLNPFISNNKPVLNAEYANQYVNDKTQRDSMCNQSLNKEFSTLILPLDLDDSFRYSCQ